MGVDNDQGRPSAREIFDETLSGARPQPFFPPLRSDPLLFQPIPHSLREFRAQEGKDQRRKRLRTLWNRLPKREAVGAVDDEAVAHAYPVRRDGDLTPESARQLGEMYEDELLGRCGVHGRGPFSTRVSWPEFEKYADAKEAGACRRPSCGPRRSCRWDCSIILFLQGGRLSAGVHRAVAYLPRRVGLGRERTSGGRGARARIGEGRYVLSRFVVVVWGS